MAHVAVRNDVLHRLYVMLCAWVFLVTLHPQSQNTFLRLLGDYDVTYAVIMRKFKTFTEHF